ncbi:MAG: pseudomurein-binding repeat-containing protein [Methanobacteriaceae archaeon]|jgi:hypothetical protein|nr:pseudomurein-binding repeat-containing protein [Methanobacteriaceae archaeon]MDO9626397.1 pseudomurein-binding repeat-containing protein [Methanobacteriaceae archaeon]
MYNLKTKKVALSFLLILGCCFIFSNTASAVDVFLTSDCISGNSTKDVSNLHSVEGYIENGSLKDKVNVTVDPNAPHPGEGERAIYSTKSNGVAVYMAASCPGTMKTVAKLASTSNKGVIFVNTGQLNLKSTSIIRRAWDDNFSNMYFAGIKTPYIFLRNAGVFVIQPNIDCAGKSQDYKNRYIANVITSIITNHPTSLTSSSGRYYNTALIATHKISPATMASVANGIYTSNKNKKALSKSYSGYRLVTFLLMATDYMNGPINKPISYREAANSHVKSTYKGYISRQDYRNIAASTNKYIRKYKRAPNYVNFKGKIIGYKDLLLMYAILTKNHTSKSGMTLASSYKFQKVYRY